MVKWTPDKDQLLLLKILETHDISVDAKKISAAWPADQGETPTARAITERLVKIRQLARSNGAGHFNIHSSQAKSSNGSSASKPSTPRKPATTVARSAAPTPRSTLFATSTALPGPAAATTNDKSLNTVTPSKRNADHLQQPEVKLESVESDDNGDFSSPVAATPLAAFRRTIANGTPLSRLTAGHETPPASLPSSPSGTMDGTFNHDATLGRGPAAQVDGSRDTPATQTPSRPSEHLQREESIATSRPRRESATKRLKYDSDEGEEAADSDASEYAVDDEDDYEV